MGAREQICQAIRELQVIQFVYDDHLRVVEPHQLAYNQKDNLALSAFWIREHSESNDRENRWREYLLSGISNVVVLDESFDGPRTGYKRTPNDRYRDAICEL